MSVTAVRGCEIVLGRERMEEMKEFSNQEKVSPLEMEGEISECCEW